MLSPRPRPHGASRNRGPRANSLGLDGSDLRALLDRLDFGWSGAEGPPRRDFVRWPFRHDFVEVRVFHPGASEVALRTACRNLSRGGISVLHSAYVHVGTVCEVGLPHRAAGATRVRGRVARCEHRGGIVHEVGIAFDHEVDVRAFIRHDPFGDCFALERVDPSRLEGRLIVVAESEPDRAAVREALRGSHLRISEAASAAEGLAFARAGCNLVLCDLHLSDATGLELVQAMRDEGITAPGILMVPALGLMLRRAVGDLAVDAVLAKPASPSLIRRAVAEFLIVRPGSCLPAPRTDPATLESCAGALAAHAHELENAARAGDGPAIRAACLRIADSGPAPEFAAVRVLALEAARALDRGAGLAEALAPLRALVRASRNSRLRRAA